MCRPWPAGASTAEAWVERPGPRTFGHSVYAFRVRVCPGCQLRYADETVYCLACGEALQALTDPLIGTVLAGRYLIQGVLGRGGMAAVYRAQEENGGPVAIKVLHAHFADDEVLRTRFEREAQATAQLAHPNIVAILDVGMTAQNVPFLAMELLEGESLDAVLERDGAMAAARVLAMALQLSRGLSRAHDFGLVHRDVKPENIILCQDDAGETVVKLVDFGIALAPDDPRLTARDVILGSPRYMAPERFRGSAASTPATDLYSLGVVLFEMCAGQPPFESETLAGYVMHHIESEAPRLRSVAPSTPPVLDDLVHELLKKNPADRPQDAHAVVARLDAVATAAQRRVRHASVLSVTSTSSESLRLDGWSERVRVYAQMLARAFPGGAPSALAAQGAELQGTVARLRRLQGRSAELSERSREAAAELQQARERLGHAVEVLARDLSERRREAGRALVPGGFVGGWADAYRAALALAVELDMREPDRPSEDGRAALRDALAAYEGWLESTQDEVLHDLEFQLSVLRSTLEKREREAQDERARITVTLTEIGHERGALESALLALAQELESALRPRAELAALFARLDASTRSAR